LRGNIADIFGGNRNTEAALREALTAQFLSSPVSAVAYARLATERGASGCQARRLGP